MRIPKEIKISGHVIKIAKKKNLLLSGMPCMGVTYLTKNKIELATHLFEERIPPGRIKETLLHEILHAIAHIHTIKLTEKEINEIALALYQTITDNKLKF